MTTETHSQPQDGMLSHPCTYGQCIQRATWQVSAGDPVCVLATVCDNHLISVCTGDISYTVSHLVPYRAAEHVVLHGATEKETEIVGMALTIAQRSEREWAEEIRRHGGTAIQLGCATLSHAFLLLWQQQSQPPACSFLPQPTVGEVLVARRVAEWPFGGTWWQARINEGQIEGRRWDEHSSQWLPWGASNPAWRWLDCRPLKPTDDVDASPIGRCECGACRKLLALRPPPGSMTGILDVLRSGVDLVRDAIHLPPPDGITPSVKALWSDVAWALSYLMQRGTASPVGERGANSILINGVEYTMPRQPGLSREDVIRLFDPRVPDELMSGFEVRYTLGDVKDELLDEGDVCDASDIVGASFRVTSVPK